MCLFALLIFVPNLDYTTTVERYFIIHFKTSLVKKSQSFMLLEGLNGIYRYPQYGKKSNSPQTFKISLRQILHCCVLPSYQRRKAENYSLSHQRQLDLEFPLLLDSKSKSEQVNMFQINESSKLSLQLQIKIYRKKTRNRQLN